ncbi:hypothetical protein, conserved [Leishmania tarentolae]|uniref:Uncharacterized protein n=1 Tax=Leishmania tarentolae TaxID=5689 RepID=A0A640KKI3_LEITA|nr:hypothetical protein, conserved [Leishmania tarentolae]
MRDERAGQQPKKSDPPCRERNQSLVSAWLLDKFFRVSQFYWSPLFSSLRFLCKRYTKRLVASCCTTLSPLQCTITRMSLRIHRLDVGSRRAVAGVLRASQVWRMRFDNAASPPPPPLEATGSATTSSSAAVSTLPRVSHRVLPSSMYPKDVSSDFIPFPLPRHDASMGFGPVRLRNVPDIEEARARMARAAQGPPRGGASTQLQDDDGDNAEAASALWAELSGETTGTSVDIATASVAVAPPEDSEVLSRALDEQDEDLLGYRVHRQFPLLDVLECDRSVDDLLAQFWNRPQREARTATVLDFAATLQRRSNEELTRVLYELSSLFEWDGNGLQFIAAKVLKYGRSYTVSSELTKAFVQLVDAMTVAFVEEQPHRLAESPALLVQVLHFLALVKIMEPNKWYTLNPNAPQNRADYTHPRGVNRTSAHVTTGRVLLDFLEDMTTSGHSLTAEGAVDDQEASSARPPLPQHATFRFTEGWSEDDILDVMAGFSGVMPDGKAPLTVVQALLDELWRRWSKVGFVLSGSEQAARLERLYMMLQVMDIQRDAVLDALLGGQIRAHDRAKSISTLPALFYERDDTPPLTLAPALTQTRGPDFFSAVSRDKRAMVKAAALQLLTASLAKSRDDGDVVLQEALVESGTELLQSLTSKSEALAFAQREQFDVIALRAVPRMTDVAQRLAEQRAEAPFFPLTASAGGLPDTAAVLAHLSSHPAPYVVLRKGRRVHPVRTLVSNLDYVAAVENVFLLHSSGVSKCVDALVAVVRRLRSGKDALIITTSCLWALQAVAKYGATEKRRATADRALDIVSYELEAGRAILMPVTDELYLHDAGTYCDEDLMLWTLAAYLARDVPLVKVHTIMSRRSRARNPQHTLRGEHSPLTSTGDLYNKSTPLLQALRSKELRAVTHHPVVQRPVRDPPQTLYNVNPIRARFVYRRDKALFDKYHVTARNLAPGFSQGALNSDLRGLGFYTPDHPQVPFTPVAELKCRPVAADSPASQ